MSRPAPYFRRSELWIPRPVEEVFPFFANAFNLEAITPPFLRFRVVTPPPIAMGAGTRIDYRLRLHGIPIRWQSEITAWEPPHRFVDEQRHGPYKTWIHEHRFSAVDGGTRVEDEVWYDVPGGDLVNRFFVRKDVSRIFDYRATKLRERFGEASP